MCDVDLSNFCYKHVVLYVKGKKKLNFNYLTHIFLNLVFQSANIIQSTSFTLFGSVPLLILYYSTKFIENFKQKNAN